MSPGLCSPFLGAAAHLIPFHYVVEGELHVAVDRGEPIRLGANQTVLFPHNDVHRMGSDLRLIPTSAGDLIQPGQDGGLSSIRYGGGGASSRVICGYLGCDAGPGSPVLACLPPTIVLDVTALGPADWIRSTFQFAADEIAAGRAGSETVLAKISELLFVQAVRGYVEAMPEGRGGWLAGLRDPIVSRALALIHRDIARAWTVDELAREAGSSRSVLADRFTRTIGVAPMHYQAQWRMQLAAQELKASGATLAQIAERVGYESDAAFSRAFKKEFGAAPASWKRAARAQEASPGPA
jgi:AraC-like DNA-binding protein